MSSLDKLANSTVVVVVEKRNLDNKIMVHFDDTYESDGCLLIGVYGTGETAEEAATAYYNKIKGKKLIINPSSKTRKEMMIL